MPRSPHRLTPCIIREKIHPYARFGLDSVEFSLNSKSGRVHNPESLRDRRIDAPNLKFPTTQILRRHTCLAGKPPRFACRIRTFHIVFVRFIKPHQIKSSTTKNEAIIISYNVEMGLAVIDKGLANRKTRFNSSAQLNPERIL